MLLDGCISLLPGACLALPIILQCIVYDEALYPSTCTHRRNVPAGCRQGRLRHAWWRQPLQPPRVAGAVPGTAWWLAVSVCSILLPSCLR